MTWVGDGDDAKAEVKRGKKVVSNRLKARAEAARANKPTADVVPSGEPSGASGADAAARGSSSHAVPRDASKDRSDDDPPAAAARGSSSSRDTKHFAVDVEKLLASIAELNAVAGDGKSSVVVGAGGERRLEPRRAKTLTLFRDGFIVDDAPNAFRAFADSARNRSYVRDLADGFFPYEYKEAYPEGVPFKLLDRSHESGAPPGNAFVAFTGGRARLDGKRGEETRVVQKTAHSKNVSDRTAFSNDATETEGKKKDAAFLEKLPRALSCATARWCACAKASGRRCAAREARRRGRRPSSRPPWRAGVSARSSRAEGCSNGVDAARDDDAVRARDAETCVSTLRVSMDGQKMYIVKLAADDTVGKLRRYLRSAGAGDDDKGCESQNFEIRNAPRRGRSQTTR